MLVEKPLALDAKDILPLIELRDRKKVLICEAFMVIYHPQWIKVRELIAAGAIGTLRHVQGAFTYHNVDPANMRNCWNSAAARCPTSASIRRSRPASSTGKEPMRVQATVERDTKFRPTSIPRSAPISATSNCPSTCRPRWRRAS